jgi:hypothetical protein
MRGSSEGWILPPLSMTCTTSEWQGSASGSRDLHLKIKPPRSGGLWQQSFDESQSRYEQ